MRFPLSILNHGKTESHFHEWPTSKKILLHRVDLTQKEPSLFCLFGGELSGGKIHFPLFLSFAFVCPLISLWPGQFFWGMKEGFYQNWQGKGKRNGLAKIDVKDEREVFHFLISKILFFVFLYFFGSLSGFFCFLLVCCFWTGTLVRRNFPRWQLIQISSASWLAGGEPPPLLMISSPLHWVIWAFKISQSPK